MEKLKRKRTYNTLFLLMSVDGKISTGIGDSRDVDKDYKVIRGIAEGLQQYYDLEQQTDLCSLNSGKVMAKMGANREHSDLGHPEVSFVIIDNSHLTERGILNLSNRLKKLYLVTKNPDHPAKNIEHKSLAVLEYNQEIDFQDLFETMHRKQKVDKITIQSGGTLNAEFLRLGLIDRLSIVLAPALIGGKETATLIDGNSLTEEAELTNVKALKLQQAETLEDSYLHLSYEVIKDTQIIENRNDS